MTVAELRQILNRCPGDAIIGYSNTRINAFQEITSIELIDLSLQKDGPDRPLYSYYTNRKGEKTVCIQVF